MRVFTYLSWTVPRLQMRCVNSDPRPPRSLSAASAGFRLLLLHVVRAALGWCLRWKWNVLFFNFCFKTYSIQAFSYACKDAGPHMYFAHARYQCQGSHNLSPTISERAYSNISKYTLSRQCFPQKNFKKCNAFIDEMSCWHLPKWWLICSNIGINLHSL